MSDHHVYPEDRRLAKSVSVALVELRAWTPFRSRRRESQRSAATEIEVPRVRDDSSLIGEVQDGSITAFEELYDRYCARAWRVALSICGDERDAEDAVEAAFVSIWTDSRSYRAEGGTVAAWLLSAVRNRAVVVAHRERVDRDSRPVTKPPSSPAASTGDRAGAAAGDRARALRERLEGLPDAQQQVIVLAFYGELTHSEIATCLGLSLETVTDRVRLALHELAAAQGEHVISDRSR